MKSLLALSCTVVLFLGLSRECSALGEWYCGKSNCYEILGVEQNATLQEIRKAYRNISLTLHPDKNRAETAADDFRKVATAYEILTDNETRSSYDYALAHPKEHLYNQYRFYRNRMYKEMKIPAQYTVTAVILIWSTVQFFTKEHMYQNAMNKIRKDPKYRARLRELLQEQQSASFRSRKSSGKARKLSELTEEEKKELEAQVDREVTVQGGRSKPALKDTLVFQLFLLPWSLAKLVWWEAQWTWRYTIKKQPYDKDAQIYLTQNFLRLSADAWDALEPLQREEMLSKELWVKEKQKAFESQQEKVNQKLMKKDKKRIAQMVAAGMPIVGND